MSRLSIKQLLRIILRNSYNTHCSDSFDQQILRFLLISKPKLGRFICAPHKDSTKIPFPFKLTASVKESIAGPQSAAAFVHKARQNLPAVILGRLFFKSLHKFRYAQLLVRVELEVHVVDHAAVFPPQRPVISGHFAAAVLERRDRREGDRAAILQLRDQFSDALREFLRRRFEVLVVDVDSVGVVFLDDGGEGRDGVF
nr:hypothetical protein CR513_41524 [Ipomoea batatas]